MNDDSKEARKESALVNLQGACAKIILEELSTITKPFSMNIQISDGFRTEYLPYPNRFHWNSIQFSNILKTNSSGYPTVWTDHILDINPTVRSFWYSQFKSKAWGFSLTPAAKCCDRTLNIPRPLHIVSFTVHHSQSSCQSTWVRLIL
jgi:hypothetical protein